MNHTRLPGFGLLPLIATDVLLATASGWPAPLAAVLRWGLHMGMAQGLLAAMAADTVPDDLRGTAFGVVNLVAGLAKLTALLVGARRRAHRDARAGCDHQ